MEDRIDLENAPSPKAEQKSKKRYPAIDLMKVIAIFLVVLHHSKIANYDFYHNEGIGYDINYWLRSIVAVSVPLFFLANGFLLLNHSYDTKKHTKRTLRLVLLTLIWAVLTVLLEIPIKGIHPSVREFFRIIWNREVGYVNHFWFMGALVCLYILFPLIKVAFDRERGAFYFFLGAAFLFTFGNEFICDLLTLVTDWMGGKKIYSETNVFNIFNPFRGIYGWPFVYFCLGGLMKEWVERFEDRRKEFARIAAGVLLLTMTGLSFWCRYLTERSGSLRDIVFKSFGTLPALIMVLCVATLCFAYQGKCERLAVVIRSIGTDTLGIYLIHYIIIYAVRDSFKTIGCLQNQLGEVIFALLILAASYAIVWILKKIPILKELVKL